MTGRFATVSCSTRFFGTVSLLACAAVLATVTACSKPQTTQQEDADIQRKAAEATVQLKAGAAKAEVVAKAATENAARRLDDVAAGVKQGMQSGGSASKPSPGRLDINSATVSQLATLPGISHATAEAIVAARPFASPHQLVKKGIVTPSEYQQIAAKLTAK